MSTRATIIIKNDSEFSEFKFKGIQLHFDGYPSHALKMLAAFDTIEKAKELIELGELSALDNSIETCVAYHRDRGERLQFSTGAHMQEIIDAYEDSNFTYFFNDETNIWEQVE